MKKFFTLLAVVLLTSASAMAQNGNNGTLKGDVNSDGLVDVADIVAVIDLIQKGQQAGQAGYFYLGTTKPTATNFTTLAGAVTTYTSIDEAVGTKVSIAAGETLYMLCPTNWLKTKDVALEDGGGETVNFSNKDAATISGYTICETQAWKVSSTATLKIIPSYYWYCGTDIYKDENDNWVLPDINENTIIEEVYDESLNDGKGAYSLFSTDTGWRKCEYITYNNLRYIYTQNARRDERNLPSPIIVNSNGELVPFYVCIPSDLNLTVKNAITVASPVNTTPIKINNINFNLFSFNDKILIYDIF